MVAMAINVPSASKRCVMIETSVFTTQPILTSTFDVPGAVLARFYATNE
jgi:hypothetical protein